MFDQAINHTFKIRSFRAGVLLLFIENYVNAGIKQYERINESREGVKESKVPKDFKEPLQQVFLDVHFYFICWDKVHDLFSRFCGIVGGGELDQIKKKYSKDFRTYSEARNHLEHIDERLVGKTKGKPAKFAGDLGNLENDYYTFWGHKYYIGEKSIEKLKEFYTDLLSWAESQV